MFRIAMARYFLGSGSIARHGGALMTSLVVLVAGCRGAERQTPAGTVTARPPSLALRVDAKYGGRQLSFEPNRGQAAAPVNYLAHGGGYSLSLQPTQAMFALGRPSAPEARTIGSAKRVDWPRDLDRTSRPRPTGKTSIVSMRLVGASAASSAVGESPLPGKVNYYIGNDPKRWHENIPTFAKVRYSGVYPGVDLVYYGTEGQLEYDFVVAPGADPDRIRVAFEGARPKLDANGDIVLAQGDAEVRLHKLIVYQDNGGAREPVAGHFVVSGDHQVRFAVADYDHGRALVIDPTVVYSTYLGGPDNDTLWGLALDSKGSAVVVGDTQAGSGAGGFPVTSGAYQATDPNPWDTAFVSKLSPDGSSLVFSTYLGGVGNGGGQQTVALAVAVDPQDGIYVGGWTVAIDFPTTAGSAQPLIGGDATFRQFGGSQPDGFVTKLSPTGTLAYSTFLGGDDRDYARAIAVDAAGDAYVAGNTYSYNTAAPHDNVILFPTTPNAYQAPFPAPKDPATGNGAGGDGEPFLAKLDPTGSTLLYSTIIAPTTCVLRCSSDGSACSNNPNNCATGSCTTSCGGWDRSASIAIDKAGIAYIGGWTRSPNFPTTAGALQTVSRPVLNPITTGFIAAFDPGKSGAASLVYSTFLGGTATSKTLDGEGVLSIAADADGNVYATGRSTSVDFPTTPGVYSTACTADPAATRCGGDRAAFVTKLDPTGSKLIYSTFVDGSKYALALDTARNAYLLSSGQGASFPLIDSVSQTGGMSIQTLSADGSTLLFSTRFESSVNANDPANNGFVVDKSGNIYVAATTGDGLPTTPGAFQTKVGVDSGGHPSNDGYVVKLSPIGAPAPDGGVGGTSGFGGAAGGAAGGAGAKGGATGSAGGGAAGNGVATTDAGTDARGDAATFGLGAGGDKSGGGGGCGVVSANAASDASSFVGLLLLATALRRRRPKTGFAGSDSVVSDAFPDNTGSTPHRYAMDA